MKPAGYGSCALDRHALRKGEIARPPSWCGETRAKHCTLHVTRSHRCNDAGSRVQGRRSMIWNRAVKSCVDSIVLRFVLCVWNGLPAQDSEGWTANFFGRGVPRCSPQRQGDSTAGESTKCPTIVQVCASFNQLSGSFAFPLKLHALFDQPVDKAARVGAGIPPPRRRPCAFARERVRAPATDHGYTFWAG